MSNSERYITDLNPYTPTGTLVEKSRVVDFRDEKWAHPALREVLTPWYSDDLGASNHATDPNLSMEERAQLAKENVKMLVEMFGNADAESTCDITTYMVSGCPEEPDAPEVEVIVYRPKDLTSKRARCFFFVLGGNLITTEPAVFDIERLCSRHNCVTVTVRFRKSWEAPYPAAINDLHAAYIWMLDNAKELGINPNNVVMGGGSTGGHLALALAFRLKRYGYHGYCPKGIVALVPQTDDRQDDHLGVYNGCWDTFSQRAGLAQWLGANAGSSAVGPEALANHATVEDCIGYPPAFIHTVEFDPDRHNNREFFGKLLDARTYAEYHCWGGANHLVSCFDGVFVGGNEVDEYSKRAGSVIIGNIEDCFKYDLRRPWVTEE